MTAGMLGSLASDLYEEPHASDDVLDERLGEVPHELKHASVYGPEGRGLRLGGRVREESAGLDSDGSGKAGHEIGRRLQAPAFEAAHRLGGHSDGLRYISLRETGLISKGSKSSPDSLGFLLSGHASSVGRQAGPQKGRSRHVIRLDLDPRARDHHRHESCR